MQTPNSLKNEKEVKIIRAIIAELKAENQKEMLKIQLLDRNTSKLWSGHMRSE